MVTTILYFGSDPADCGEMLAEQGEGPPRDVFATTHLDAAINQLLDTDFDCVLIDEGTTRSDFQLLARTAKLIDGTLPIVYGDQAHDFEEDGMGNYVDVSVEPTEGVDTEALNEGDRRRPAVGALEHDPMIEGIHKTRTRRGLCHVSRRGTYRWANDRMGEVVGREPSALVGESLRDYSPLEDPASLTTLVRTAVDRRTVQWTRDEDDPNGQIICVYPVGPDSALLVTYPPESTYAFGGTYLNRLKEIFFIVDFDGEFVYWNNSLNEVTGYRDAELREMTAFELFPTEERPEAEDKLQDVAVTGEQSVELPLVTKDGESITYEFSGSLIDGPNGEPRYVCGIGRDISRRVEMRQELDTAIERLEESNAALERFAYVASHDLREPLRMVRSYLQLLQRRYAEELDEDAQEFIEFAVDGAERMQTMMKDLLEYSRVGTEVHCEPVDCNDVLADVRSNLQVSIDEAGAEVTREELPTVAGDRTLLVQLFQNLLANAIEHRGDSPPRVQVTADRRDDRWMFAVRDDNEGISGAEDDIFDLFSSGPQNDGFGIGLATCRKIVETFDGEISVESQEGVGTTFRFTLPAAESG